MIVYPKLQACLMLALCVLRATSIAATSPTSVTNMASATWSDRGPYQKVGQSNSGLGIVKLPAPVVAAIQGIMPEKPSHWALYDGLHDFAGHGWRIVQFYGDADGYVTLLQAQGNWTLLSAPASLPILNEVLDPLVPADLRNHDKFRNYLWHVVLLQRHGRGTFLDKEFQRGDVDTYRYKQWTNGTKTERRQLRALCHDPTTARSGDRLLVRLNVITMQGAVERWTFHLRLGKSVKLEGTEVRQVLKKGAFYYPLM